MDAENATERKKLMGESENINSNLETMMSLYKTMIRIRKIEEEISSRYNLGKMRCPTHLSIGQEAVPAAMSLCTTKKDFAVSTHRCHAHYLAKGGDLKGMIAELYGKSTGCSGGKGGSMHLIDLKAGFAGSSAIVGNSIPIGTGIGLSLRLKHSNNISIVYMGEGATEEGTFYESLNFAELKKLNVLFICENNLYSVYSPLSVRQPMNRSTMKIVEGMGLKHYKQYDGNDAIQAYKGLKGIIEIMRAEGGPAFIEFATYRWREHCGPNYDNNVGYREEKEFLEWKQRDPILQLKAKLLADFQGFETWNAKILGSIKSEINNAFEFAETSDFPRQEEVNLNIYASKNDHHKA